MEEGNGKGELVRHLTFRDLFFLSFGGMSPLLSILTYGAFAYTLAGYDAPLVMIIGTALVLVNGLAVTRLSRRFSSSGGYYTYAFQALSARIGFDTGWMYIFYSILYGLAYLMGGIYILNFVFGFSDYLGFALLIVPAIIFFIVGISISSRYAFFAVLIEISIMVAIILLSFILSKGVFYFPNPSFYHVTSGGFVLGILFAMGIPTGYGSIAPVSGEVKDPKRDVGRSVIAVILTGGILATLVIYALADLVLQTGFLLQFSNQLPIIQILRDDFEGYGRYIFYVVAIATVNDAILAILAFGSAASRTIFRMGLDRSFPTIFAKKDRRNSPIVAVLFTSGLMVLLPLVFLQISSAEVIFIVLGTISSLGGLFIHITADFSLIRIGLRRGRRLALKTGRTIKTMILDFNEFILAVLGAVISTIVIIYSAYSTVPVYTTIFLTWIVIGFVLSEVKSIVTKTPYLSDLSREEQMVAKNLQSLRVNDENVNTISSVFSIDEKAINAINDMLAKHTATGIVVDKFSNPIGVVNAVDLLLLPKATLDRITLRRVRLERVVSVDEALDIAEALRILKENNVDVLAIVDKKGRCIGSLSDREILNGLGNLNKTEPA
ncbi:MAG: amino acid permease [Candidatus Thermoplasmatota archaeon]|nr:amino acid permease [Candidatus Thermoplasmatota archaeon]